MLRKYGITLSGSLRRTVTVGAALGLGTATLLGIANPLAAQASTKTVLVSSTDLVTGTPAPGQFVTIEQGGTGGSVGMVYGPAAPPLGVGSLQMKVTGTSDHWSVYNYDHIGTKLTDINTLSYSTYTDNTTTAPVLQMEINPGNTSVTGGPDQGITYSTVNFEPYNQTGAVTANTWQSWNVLNGKVWGTHLTGAPISAPVSWSTFVSEYPNAAIKYGFGVNVGSGWSAMTGEADALTIGTSANTTVYNFEQTAAYRPFKSSGSGTETPGVPGCQFTADGCTVVSHGSATSSHLGTGAYTSTLTIDWASATSNGAGGYCAPANGSGTLTAANGDTLNQSELGTVCEVGATGSNVPHSFNGYFYDTGGTGRFSDAIGGGMITGGDGGTGISKYSESGSISY